MCLKSPDWNAIMLKVRAFSLFAAITLFAGLTASAQWRERPTTGSPQRTLPDRTNFAGMSGMGPQLEVGLKEHDQNAKDKRAVVEVEVWGVGLIEPDANREPNLTEAYLTYRMDDQPVIKTAEKEHTFSNLSPGYHTISVQLASSSGQPVGARMELSVKIPK
jgi:hypothetical protein